MASLHRAQDYTAIPENKGLLATLPWYGKLHLMCRHAQTNPRCSQGWFAVMHMLYHVNGSGKKGTAKGAGELQASSDQLFARIPDKPLGDCHSNSLSKGCICS